MREPVPNGATITRLSMFRIIGLIALFEAKKTTVERTEKLGKQK
jgi:hypothetical protein